MGNTHGTYLDPLIKLQKKCVRVIIFSHYLEHTPHLFKQLDILSFKRLVVQIIYLLMFKCHIGLPLSQLITFLYKYYSARLLYKAN